MASTNPCHVVTGKARFSYEHIMKPYANTTHDPNAEPKFSLTVLIPKTDVATKAKIDAAIQAAKKAGVASKKYRDGTPIDRLPIPVYDGDGYRADGFTPFGPECKGMWVFTANCKADRPPKVVDANRQDILDPTEIYSGIWGRVGVDFFPYNSGSKQGVGCQLINVQKLSDGEPLGAARPSVDDDFGDSDEDPLS